MSMEKRIVIMPYVTSGDDFYFTMPYRGIVRNITGAVNADPGDAKTVTVTGGGETLGTFTAGSSVSAGDTITYTINTSTGETVLDEGAVVKLDFPSLDATTTYGLMIELDPFARVTE